MSSIVSWFSWLYRHGRLVEKGSAEDYATRPQRGERSDLPTPYITRDTLPPGVTSQLDGRTYESRSELYRHYKQHGKRIVEAGEKPADASEGAPRITKAEIYEAKQKLEQGYRPEPLEQAEPDELPSLPDKEPGDG